MKAVSRVSAAALIAAALIVIAYLLGFVESSTLEQPAASPGGQKTTKAHASEHSKTSTSSPGASNARRFRCSAEDFQAVAPELSQSEDQRREDDEEQFAALVERLATSSDLEHRVTAALFKAGNGYPDAIDDIAALLPTLPQHPLLHWRLLDACAIRPTHALCAAGDTEERVIRVLGGNGEAWAKIAYYRLQRDDMQAGIEALLNASAAAEFDDYWSAQVALTYYALAGDDNSPVTARLVDAIGYVSAFAEPYVALARACPLGAKRSPDWLKACLAYGERMEAGAQSLIGKAIGIGLQRNMHAAAGDTEKAQQAAARGEFTVTALHDPTLSDGQVLLAANESLALEFLQRLTVYGQLSANQFLRGEVERFSALPNYDPCPPVLPM